MVFCVAEVFNKSIYHFDIAHALFSQWWETFLKPFVIYISNTAVGLRVYLEDRTTTENVGCGKRKDDQRFVFL